MHKILVLCIGNICRSPMAEGLLAHALPGYEIRSAGIGALIGRPAEPFAVQLMAEKDIDITAHRAQQISSQLVGWADLILVMDQEQKKYVESQYIASRGKVFRIGESAKDEVPDPYRGTMDSFRVALGVIEAGVAFWAAQIPRLT
jgi:protein-tyrosine phosphatase